MCHQAPARTLWGVAARSEPNHALLLSCAVEFEVLLRTANKNSTQCGGHVLVYLCFLTYIFGDRQEGEIFTVVAFISHNLESEKLFMIKSVAPGTCCIFDFKTEFFVLFSDSN